MVFALLNLLKPTKKQWQLISATYSHNIYFDSSFRDDPHLITKGDSWNIDR